MNLTRSAVHMLGLLLSNLTDEQMADMDFSTFEHGYVDELFEQIDGYLIETIGEDWVSEEVL